jgi:hypothetical protein
MGLKETFDRATTVVVCASLLLTSCARLKDVEREQVQADELRGWDDKQIDKEKKRSPFLKAHMRNGDLFVLENWQVTAGKGDVFGNGTHYNTHRQVITQGPLSVPIDSVAIFETNHLELSGVGAGLTVLAVVTAAGIVICAFNPKQCFGSCPTFYVFDADRPVAEGFSASIAPSLEATDIDAVGRSVRGGPLEVHRTNEALETHAIRFVHLLAAPHAPGARVFADRDGTLWTSSRVSAPVRAQGPEGDILQRVRSADGEERSSLADSTNLAARETLRFAFDPLPAGTRAGVVIGCRQSLLSTYLLYQTLAYMGTQAGHWIASLERGDLGSAGAEIVNLLGGIDVRVELSSGQWIAAGTIDEFGPIATDRHLVTFEVPPDWSGNVELTLTRGGWRIDNVALARLDGPVSPLRLDPVDVARDGATDTAALDALRDPDRHLATLPGDRYTLVYDIPDDGRDYEIFIESRGYYLEWIRDEWLHEESPAYLAEVFFDPRAALIRLAPEYKKLEPGMERAFWSSRYEKP